MSIYDRIQDVKDAKEFNELAQENSAIYLQATSLFNDLVTRMDMLRIEINSTIKNVRNKDDALTHLRRVREKRIAAEKTPSPPKGEIEKRDTSHQNHS